MNATELTVGDWVNVKTRDRQTNKDVVKAGRIVSIEPYFKHIGVAFTPEDAKRWFGFGFPPEYIEPLPLTKDALAKSGFFIQDQGGNKADVWCGFGEDCQYDIEVEFDGETPVHVKIDGPTHITTREIEFIHQFQHALRLAGVNKEITI